MTGRDWRACSAGEIDSYEASPTGAIAAAAHGADIKLLGCEWLNVPHGLMVRDDIKSVKDLEGKSIAVSAPGSMPDMIARAALAKANVPGSLLRLGGRRCPGGCCFQRIPAAAVLEAFQNAGEGSEGRRLRNRISSRRPVNKI